jgi:hypothetical protein
LAQRRHASVRFVYAVSPAPGQPICGSISAEVVMLPSFSRTLRIALVLALSAGFVAWYGQGHSAYAAPDDEDEGGDDDDGGGGKGASEDEDPDDKDQPPVTAGGLFTMATYPVNEILRPLVITEGIGQIRIGVGTDLSDKGAFGSGGFSIEGQYGVSDNFAVLGGFTNAYNFAQLGLYAGFEGALIYDLVDIRLAANLHRFAVPRFSNFCSPSDPTDPDNPMAETECKSTMMPMLVTLPNGKYGKGDLKLSFDLGFPFRYSLKPEIAIIALQTLISIDTDSKPDLNPSIGVATNPIPQLSVVAFAQLRIIDFDTSQNNFQIPVTGRVEFSPNQKLDIGLEFTLLNIKPPEPQKPFDNRFISLFGQFRFGK